MASKMLEYGNFPVESFFIFYIFVLALSKGKEKNALKNPAPAEALR